MGSPKVIEISCYKCGAPCTGTRRARNRVCPKCKKALLKRLIREWRDENPVARQSIKYGGLRSGHPEWRAQRLALQDGLCDFCGKTEKETRKPFHTDHDHRFNYRDPRGWRRLLCGDCNRGFGLFHENPAALAKAALAAFKQDEFGEKLDEMLPPEVK